MIQDNNIESLKDAAKRNSGSFLETNTQYNRDINHRIYAQRKSFIAGANWQAEQYKDLIQSHERLLIALTALVEYVGEGGTVNSYANEAIEKANSIINQQK